MYRFIDHTQTYDVSTPRLAYEAAKAYASFARLLQEVCPSTLREPLPDFHNTAKRYHRLGRVLSRAPSERRERAHAEIGLVQARAAQVDRLGALITAGTLPVRVTHNDTKLNNILFDTRTGAGVCVVDLDTVMPGLSLYDFGDLVRSAATTAAEDEPDLDKVQFSLEIFTEIVHGYLAGAASMLVDAELEHLCFAARLITLECGMRFLTDYLEGDVYFKTSHEHHNLMRCRTQLKLVQEMEQCSAAMEAVVARAR